MTAGQVVVLISLLCRVYSAPEPVMQCMVAAESDYNVNSINGVHLGLAQYHPDTLEWLGELAGRDPLWLHGYMPADATDPVYSLALMAWAMAHGYGEHWSTWTLCGGE